jgi:hypothetical protein
MRVGVITLSIAVSLLAACPAKQQGAIEGSVAPPGQGIRATVSFQGRQVVTGDADSITGTFHVNVPPGTYDVSITAPTAPFPVVISGVIVRSGETTKLTPVALPLPETGNAAITGTVRAAGGNARVTLLAEGVERASVTTDARGRYEFEGVPAGRYAVQVQAQGYARDVQLVSVSDGSKATQDFRMLYITALDGVDWDKGILRVRGVGMPPVQAPTPTVRKELAKRAALADAERNILRVIQLVQTGPGENLAALLGEKTFAQKLQGYVQGYRVAAERGLDGGRVEIELELPLTGPGGLTSYLGPF